MKKMFWLLVAIILGLSSCDNAMFEAPSVTLKFKFVNFNTVSNGPGGFLAGGFPVGAWSVSAYPLTWSGGNSNEYTIPGFVQLDKILFRIVDSGWGEPAGISYALLKPNAKDANGSDDYGSTDDNWGVGNGDTGNGKVKPAGGFKLKLGATHEIKVDGRGGNQVAYIYIDDVLKFDGTY